MENWKEHRFLPPGWKFRDDGGCQSDNQHSMEKMIRKNLKRLDKKYST